MGWIWGTYMLTLPPAIWGNWRAFSRRVTKPAVAEDADPISEAALAISAD
jgi:hypothetical protein